METVEITTRSDFALWAIERAQEIVRSEGSALALAARDMDEVLTSWRMVKCVGWEGRVSFNKQSSPNPCQPGDLC